MGQEEAATVELAIQGDPRALDQLIGLYEKRVYNIALRVMGNEHDAYDAAQETLIKIYTRIGSFRRQSAFSSWVYKLTVNTCIDLLRKNKKKTVSFDAITETGVSFCDESIFSNPEAVVANDRLGARIQQALMALDYDQRIVVVLKDIQGFSYEEISQIVGISLGTVKSRLFRAREKLKQMLSDLLGQ